MIEFQLKELSPWADIATMLTRMSTLTVAVEKGQPFGKRAVVKSYTGRARLTADGSGNVTLTVLE